MVKTEDKFISEIIRTCGRTRNTFLVFQSTIILKQSRPFGGGLVPGSMERIVERLANVITASELWDIRMRGGVKIATLIRQKQKLLTTKEKAKWL